MIFIVQTDSIDRGTGELFYSKHMREVIAYYVHKQEIIAQRKTV